jgi:hypothetical protein
VLNALAQQRRNNGVYVLSRWITLKPRSIVGNPTSRPLVRATIASWVDGYRRWQYPPASQRLPHLATGRACPCTPLQHFMLATTRTSDSRSIS